MCWHARYLEGKWYLNFIKLYDYIVVEKKMAEIMVLEGDVVQASFTLLTKNDEEIASLEAQIAQLTSGLYQLDLFSFPLHYN